jgi:hypothetical protein
MFEQCPGCGGKWEDPRSKRSVASRRIKKRDYPWLYEDSTKICNNCSITRCNEHYKMKTGYVCGIWIEKYLILWYEDNQTSVFIKNILQSGSKFIFKTNYHLPYNITLDRLEKLLPLI